jgi:hypothetical protein
MAWTTLKHLSRETVSITTGKYPVTNADKGNTPSSTWMESKQKVALSDA